MSENKNPDWRFATRAVRAGQERSEQGEQGEPIFTTSSFVFDTAEAAADRFAGRTEGNIYSRFTNPTVRMFEKRMAALEGGESCVATGSGMVAILATCMALLKAGDHIVSSRSIFGSTTLLFTNYLGRFGIATDFVDLKDLSAWEAAIQDNTRLLFIETPSNPLLELVDIKELAQLAHRHGCLLVVDNTLCTAALQVPLALGADVSIVSTTKYIDGQGRTVGGAVIGSKELVGTDVYGFQRTCGPSMSPFNAWVALKGLETLELRMEAHSRRALELAQWLEAHDRVDRVYYTGLDSHPQHALAQQQQRAGGGVLSFEIKGGQQQAWQFCDATQLVSITANLGDTKTILTHPATTTHGRVSPEVRAAAGISDGLLRVAVGLEDVEDLKLDLQRGFDALG
ncbi:MAG: O-succinylhomoserine sulfhydrylase [Gammaproteobacteria bacterium]|nr:O-succinylhomoserine sulfhydrylase [Gammaproteobacteria bacterium]